MLVNMEIFGLFLRTLGEIMIGFTVVMVHRRVWKEHKIDEKVYKDMKREQVIVGVGITLLIVGFLIEVYPFI